MVFGVWWFGFRGPDFGFQVADFEVRGSGGKFGVSDFGLQDRRFGVRSVLAAAALLPLAREAVEAEPLDLCTCAPLYFTA